MPRFRVVQNTATMHQDGYTLLVYMNREKMVQLHPPRALLAAARVAGSGSAMTIDLS
eukprot:SAG22_NODE_13366_length_409_cov_0.845161_1_plen_57_part_00